MYVLKVGWGNIQNLDNQPKKINNLANLQNTNPGKEVGRGNLKFLLHA